MKTRRRHYQDGLRVFQITFNEGARYCEVCGELYWDVELHRWRGLGRVCRRCVYKATSQEKRKAERRWREKRRVTTKRPKEELEKRVTKVPLEPEYALPSLGKDDLRTVTAIEPLPGRADRMLVTLAGLEGSPPLVFTRTREQLRNLRVGQLLQKTSHGRWFGYSSSSWLGLPPPPSGEEERYYTVII